MNKKVLFILFLSAFLFGINQIFSKYILSNSVDVFTFVFLLTLFTFIFTFLFILFKKRDKKTIYSVIKTNWKALAIIGFLVSGISRFFKFSGLSLSTATNGGVFQSISILSTVFFASLFFKESLSKRQLFFILLIVLGVYLLSTNGGVVSISTGDYLFIIAYVIAGFANSYSKEIMHSLKSNNSYVVSLGRAFFGLIAMSILALIFPVNINLSLTQYLLIIDASLLLSIRILIFYESIHVTSASYGATFLLLGALLTPIFAYLFIGETVSTLQIFSILLIIGSAYLLVKNK